MSINLDVLNQRFEKEPIESLLRCFLESYKGRIALASSFGAEDQVLTDMILNIDSKGKIFTLDTGRLPEA